MDILTFYPSPGYHDDDDDSCFHRIDDTIKEKKQFYIQHVNTITTVR